MFNIVISGKRIISALCCCALIFLCVMYFLCYFISSESVTKYEVKNSDKERRIFIESFGHTLNDLKPTVDRITIPSEFNNTYKQFEELQNKMGLSLEKFKGKTVNKYTYTLADNVTYAELYMYKDYVVAGAIVNPDLKEGYIKALNE